MVVILIVQAPSPAAAGAEDGNRLSSFVNGRSLDENSNSGSIGGPGERLSTTATNTTSVSFVSSTNSSSSSGFFQVDSDNNKTATTKEEEWVTKKKVELTTKKQIETRVKRQVVLEDGKVVEDSGPIVTTNTTEDTEKQEHEQTEHRQLGDDEQDGGWVAVTGTDGAGNGIIKEVRENKIRSREEKQETLETEDVQHLGDITDEAYKKAIQSNRKDIRLALRQASSNKELSQFNNNAPRIVHYSTKTQKTVDKEDTKHLTGIQKDGKLVTETTKTTEHEEVNDTEEPDDKDDEEEEYETHQSSSQKFRKTKDQEFVEYLADGVKIGEQIRYEAETVEGDRKGNPESLKMDSIAWESLSEKIRRMRREKQKQEEAERMDALTKKPLNFDQEEQTRKVETSKWLEHHFGSESRSSGSSLADDDSPKKSQKSTSFINVTMKSSTPISRKQSEPLSGITTTTTSSSNNEGLNRSHFKGVSEWKSSKPTAITTTTTNTKTTAARSPSPVRRADGEYIIKPKIERSSSLNDSNIPSSRRIEPVSRRKGSSDNERSYSPFQPINEKMQTSSSRHSSSSKYRHNYERSSSPISPPNELPPTSSSTPLYASVQQRSKYSNGNHDNEAAANPQHFYRNEKRTADYSNNLSSDGGYFSNNHIKEEDEELEEEECGEQQYAQPIKKSNLVKKDSTNRRKWSDHYQHHRSRDDIRGADIPRHHRSRDDIQEDIPSPDYSPKSFPRKAPSTPDIRITNASPPPGVEGYKSGKKIYQKTRFAADIPLVKSPQRNVENGKKSSKSSGGGISETFRKLVGKFRSGSGDRKSSKKSGKTYANNDNQSVSSSTMTRPHNGYHSSSYQSFGSDVDNGISESSVRDSGGSSGARKPVSKSDSDRSRNASSPPVSRRSTYTNRNDNNHQHHHHHHHDNNVNHNVNNNGIATAIGTQTLDKNYRVKSKKKAIVDEENMHVNGNSRHSPAHKYYLGENPFGRSLYGNEKEYDGTTYFRRRYKNSNSTSTDEDRKGIIRNHTTVTPNSNETGLLGSRLSKSTSRLASENTINSSSSRSRPTADYSRGGIQTLPRKLRDDDKSIKKQVYINEPPSSDQETIHSRRLTRHSNNNNSGSMINVSVVNNVNPTANTVNSGPTKPVRTYRTSLLRSKSFNVQPGYRMPERSIYVSNPQLHRLEESPPPLKSPGIVTSINRSTKDLSKSSEEDDYFSYNNNTHSTLQNGYNNNSTARHEDYHHGNGGNRSTYQPKRLIGFTTTTGSTPSSSLKKPSSVQYSSSFHSPNYHHHHPPVVRKPTVSFDTSVVDETDRRSPSTAGTLNGGYISRRSSPDKSTSSGDVTTNKTVTRQRGSRNSDDYSETVRITSKSNDPLRPSVTNTVQSFSKKTVPSKSGRLETIESSETTRVTKSHYKGSDNDDGNNPAARSKYNSKNGSVVIEVRNGNR